MESRADERQRVFRRRRLGVLAGVATVVLLAVVLGTNGFGGSTPADRRSALGARQPRAGRRATPIWTVSSWLAGLEAKVKGQPGHLQPGSNPSVLPGPILIADRNNSRLLLVDPKGRILWQFPSPGDLLAGQVFKSPDDAFFSSEASQDATVQVAR